MQTLRYRNTAIISFIAFILVISACSKNDVTPQAITPTYQNPPPDTSLPHELVFDQLYWEVHANTKQLVTRLTVPDSYSINNLKSVAGVGDRTIGIPKYNGNSGQSLYYIKSFNQVVVYKNYSDNPPQIVQTGNYYEDLVKALVSYTSFIKRSVGFSSIKLRF